MRPGLLVSIVVALVIFGSGSALGDEAGRFPTVPSRHSVPGALAGVSSLVGRFTG